MKQHFMMFAAYNQWANGRIYDAAGDLSDEEFNRDTGAFFGSMMGTLNHILTADRIWMKRFIQMRSVASRWLRVPIIEPKNAPTSRLNSSSSSAATAS